MLAQSPPKLPPQQFSFDPIESQDIVYPNTINSSDETADDYERTSSARSMSSLATSVDSQEQHYVVDKQDEDGYFNSNSGLKTVDNKPPKYANGSQATTPTAASCSSTRKHPSVLIPNGNSTSSGTVSPGTIASASIAPPINNNNVSPQLSPITPSTSTNFTRPFNNSRKSGEYNASNSVSQQHLPKSPSSSSTSLPMLSKRSSSTSAISRNTNNNNSSMQPPPPPPVTTQPQSSSTVVATAPKKQNNFSTNRASISSQVSNASTSHSLYRTITSAGHSHHRPSFSFSRRRSLAGQGVSTNSVHIDESSSVSAQDIERLRELIVAQRESKRKRREFLEDERVLVGTKVSEGDQNFATAYNMLTGIRVSVSRCNAKVNHDLTDADFTARHKLAFDITGNELTPSAKYDFKFKDYAPYVFRHLRELFRLDPADYLISLTSKYIVSELGSPGKSGSFFYFSRDYRFIIKTIHHQEHKMLRKILKEYYTHVKNNPNTLVSQFYGLHRVKLPFGRKIHFIVMNNLFPAHRDIHRTYDLKGSTLGRYLPESKENAKRSVVFKDLNWLKHDESIKLGPKKKQDFIKQLEIDVALLKRLNIMDYSLLIGIHDLNKGNSEHIRDSTLSVFEPSEQLSGLSKSKAAELRKALNATSPTALNAIDFAFDEYMRRDFKFYADSGGYRSTDENDNDLGEIYYLGIIDCLTPYTFQKRVETFWKGLSHARPTISAIPAVEYGDRFLNFIKNVVSDKAATKTLKPINEQQQQQQTLEPPPASNTGSSHLPALTEASSEAQLPI